MKKNMNAIILYKPAAQTAARFNEENFENMQLFEENLGKKAAF